MKHMSVDELRQEFNEKNALLEKLFSPVSAVDFVGDVWWDPDQLLVIIEDEMYRTLDVDAAFDFWVDRDDVYVPPCSFFQGCYKTQTVDEVYAMVIDVDNITAWGLNQVIQNQLGVTIPLPTYIVNSGGGVHFYYVFDAPIPHFKVNRPLLKKLYNRLWFVCDRNISCRVDKTGLIQPFRMPGSRTKLDQTARAFSVNDKWSPEKLLRRLGIEDEGEFSYWDPNGYKEKKKSRTFKESSETGGNAHPAFYRYCYDRILSKTREGHRYMSMYALAVVANKARIPEEVLREDMTFLWEKFNATGAPMKRKELEKAMKGYTVRRKKVRSETLEEWFGWEFPRNSAKRRKNPLNRDDGTALKAARAVQNIIDPDGNWRNKNGRPVGAVDKKPRKTKQDLILNYAAENPDASVTEIARALGVSRSTVYKWLRGL